MLTLSQALNLLTQMHEEDEEGARGRRARSHSRRRAILGLFSEGDLELTPAQIRAKLPGTPPLGNVNYHLRVLEQTRLLSENGGYYKLP